MLPALLLSCALVAAAERELKPVGKLAEYTDAHGRGPRKSKKVQHVDAPLSADARPADLPQLREYASWGAWLDARAALEDARRRRGGPGGTRVVPLVANSSLPLFVIAGVQKGGTTFLRKLMNAHPMLSAGRGLSGKCEGEIHFFDMHMPGLGAKLVSFCPTPQDMITTRADCEAAHDALGSEPRKNHAGR